MRRAGRCTPHMRAVKVAVAVVAVARAIRAGRLELVHSAQPAAQRRARQSGLMQRHVDGGTDRVAGAGAAVQIATTDTAVGVLFGGAAQIARAAFDRVYVARKRGQGRHRWRHKRRRRRLMHPCRPLVVRSQGGTAADLDLVAIAPEAAPHDSHARGRGVAERLALCGAVCLPGAREAAGKRGLVGVMAHLAGLLVVGSRGRRRGRWR